MPKDKAVQDDPNADSNPDSSPSEGDRDPQVDPWSGTSEESQEPQDPEALLLAEAQAALDPVHLDPLSKAPGGTEPMIVVQTPEGSQHAVPARLQPQYEQMGFEVLVDSNVFGRSGTLTAQADPADVEAAELQRQQVEAQLKRR